MMRILILMIVLAVTVPANAQEAFTLDEAIEYGLTHHNDIRSAMLDVKDADAQVTEFRAIGLPQVDGSINYQHYFEIPVSPVEDFLTPTIYGILSQEFEEIPPFQGNPEVFEFSLFRRNSLTAGVDMKWLLLDGSYFSGLKAAKLFKELTRKGVDVKEEDLRARITRAYMNILIAEENKHILSRNIDNLTSALSDTRAYYENGFMESLDVERMELSMEQLQTEYEKLDQLIAISYNLLKFQMAYPLHQDIYLKEDLEQLVARMSIEDVDLAEEIDYTEKPEYEQILLGRELNELNLERYKRGYLPNLMAKANINRSLQRDNLFNEEELGWIPTSSVSLSINVPIFDGLKKKGQIQQVQIELDQINIRKQEFERAVTLQVTNARLQYINARKTLQQTRRSLQIVESIYDKTMTKFNEGVGSSVEVTQAENQLYDAQGNYITALYELLISKTELDIALGQI